MDTAPIHDALVDALKGRHLLDHPFYRRWEAGQLAEGELAAYAEQYRLLERQLPVTLSAVVTALDDGDARTAVAANLADELGRPEAHATLFESFAEAAGARADDVVTATPATTKMLAEVRTAAASDPVAALAMVAAYEVQAADIASSKSEGLRRHYGFDAAGTRFWDVHVHQEREHAGWSTEALAALGTDPDQVLAAAKVAADAWWDFLTERDALAPAGVAC